MRRPPGVVDPSAARTAVVLAACLLCAAVFLPAGCGRGETEAQRRARLEMEGRGPGPVARVKVSRAGAIELNGQPASFEQVKEEFARHRAAGGAVWFYREDWQGEPHEQALRVVLAATEEGLGVRKIETEEELNQPQ